MQNAKQKLKKKIIMSVMLTVFAMVMIFLVGVTNLFAQEATAAPATGAVVAAAKNPEVSKFALVAAAVAFGFGALGAGIAVGNVGAAAMGAIGEKPEIAGQAIIFVALAEGLAVFGLIIAILILGQA